MTRRFLLRPPIAAGLILAGLAVIAAAGCGTEDRPDLPDQGAEILWDEYGVPHIYASDGRALFRGYGWAQMESHAPRLLRLVGTARGRAAEYFGGDERLASDRWVHTVGIPERADRWYAEQDSTMRRYLDAFAAGINAWAEANPDALPSAERRVLPVHPPDLLALIQHQIHFTFMVQQGVVRSLRRSWTPGSALASGGGPSGGAERGRRLPAPPRAASNAWAVSPERSASGNALLLANPHLPWGGRFTWYEAHLVAPGVDATGASLLGQPLIGIGYNDRMGWTHTVNTHDGVDLYELELADGGSAYRWNGGTREFDVDVDTLRIRGEGGGLRDTTVRVRRSVHGPVLISRDGHAVAMRVAGLEEGELFRQYWEMIRAGSLAEFEDAVRRMQMPMFTVMYADRDGRVMHLFGGRTPDRPGGPWDWDRIVPGDTSATLWTAVHAYDELPRVVDPPSGWLQNANDPPWTTTFPRALEPDSFPAYMAPRGMGLRPQRSARMLRADSSVTYAELVDYKHSTRMLAADRLLDDLLPTARERGGETARRAADVLEAWDRESDADSRGAPLFRAFFFRLRESEAGVFAEPWSPDRPLATPDGLADPEAAVAALEAAARDVEERFGRLDAAWGETRRYRADGTDLPGNGADGRLGVFRVVDWRRADSLYRATGGDSYVAALEFTPEGVRARSLIGYGNASRPEAPGPTHQLGFMSEKRLRPAWRSRAEIREHMADRTVVP